MDHLIEAQESGFITSDEAETLDALAGKAMASLTALHRDLRSTPDPDDRTLGPGSDRG